MPEPVFFDLEARDRLYETAAAAILPVPYERTVSYGAGTRKGPVAVLEASLQVELYDEELDLEPFRQGIATLPPCEPAAAEPGAAIAEIGAAARPHLEAGKFLALIGGEHALTSGPALAAREVLGEIGVVQFDAHADLRQSYGGTPWSHACVMRRLHEAGLPALAIGLRSLSREEMELLRSSGQPVVWGRELPDLTGERFRSLLARLPPRVYLTIDLDYFDPSLVPATGTPEPGGGLWQPTLDLLRDLFATKEVVAMDLVELAPLAGQPASDFLAARLLYKCLGYRLAARGHGPVKPSRRRR